MAVCSRWHQTAKESCLNAKSEGSLGADQRTTRTSVVAERLKFPPVSHVTISFSFTATGNSIVVIFLADSSHVKSCLRPYLSGYANNKHSSISFRDSPPLLVLHCATICRSGILCQLDPPRLQLMLHYITIIEVNKY